MNEPRCISEKQYSILLSFALMLIFTTGSVLSFFGALFQVVLFCLLMREVFTRVSNPRICWGIFLVASAAMCEVALSLSHLVPDAFPESSFFLLPASTYLFLSAPMFGYFSEEKQISLPEMGRGFLYYAISGLFLSTIREIGGSASFGGLSISVLGKAPVPFFGHTAASALLVLLDLVLLPGILSSEEQGNRILQTEEGLLRKYHPIRLSTEKQIVKLFLCLLVYDVLFGVLGALLLPNLPGEWRHPTHVVVLSTLSSLLLFTLIVKLFRQNETLDEYRYIPLLGVITTSLPLIFFMRDVAFTEESKIKEILLWISVMIGVWIASVVVISFIRVIHGRLLFGKRPRILEGVPFVILNVTLALMVFMPWTTVLPRL